MSEPNLRPREILDGMTQGRAAEKRAADLRPRRETVCSDVGFVRIPVVGA